MANLLLRCTRWPEPVDQTRFSTDASHHQTRPRRGPSLGRSPTTPVSSRRSFLPFLFEYACVWIGALQPAVNMETHVGVEALSLIIVGAGNHLTFAKALFWKLKVLKNSLCSLVLFGGTWFQISGPSFAKCLTFLQTLMHRQFCKQLQSQSNERGRTEGGDWTSGWLQGVEPNGNQRDGDAAAATVAH